LRRHFAGLFRSSFGAYPHRDGDRSSGGPMPRQAPAKFRQVPKLFLHQQSWRLAPLAPQGIADPFPHSILPISTIVNE
jgi:hypothetical protein